MSTIPTATITSHAEPLAATRSRQAAGVVAFAVLTALSARLSLPVPGSAIPFSFQPLAVILAGGLLGARLGAASQILYLAAGLVGLPVFVLGSILAPSGGYLMAYPFAAFAVGSLAGRSILRTLGALLCGVAIIYAGGVAWWSLFIGLPAAFQTGVIPFVPADLVKVALALVVVTSARDRVRSLFGA